MLYDDIPSAELPNPSIYVVMSICIDPETHFSETTTHGYFQTHAEAALKFQRVADYAAKNDADPGQEVLLDTDGEFAYVDGEGRECHVLVHCAA